MNKVKVFLRNVKMGFATNSSSYHSMIMMTEEDKKKWEAGEIEVQGYSYKEWYESEYAEYDERSLTVGDTTVYVFAQYGDDY